MICSRQRYIVTTSAAQTHRREKIITFINKAAADQAAAKLNDQFKGAGYAVTYIGQPYAKFMKVPRGGFYVVNPWGKLV